jgi:rare lipoprotein A
MRTWLGPSLLVATFLLTACSTTPTKPPSPAPAPPGAPTPPSKPGYYQDDASAARQPRSIPDAPRLEALHRPPTVRNCSAAITPATLVSGKERGVVVVRQEIPWREDIDETYDMYAMTAAHPTLPLPSYARVTNATTGKSVIVRVNDRGPFLHDRVIDLSYAAAYRIGIAQKGSGLVEVEAIIPSETVIVATTPLPSVESAPVAALPASRSPMGTPPVAASDGGFVQLGAFSNYANRTSSRTRELTRAARGRSEGPAGRVFPRVRRPYPSREEARRTGDRLRDALGLPTTIAVH